MKDVLQRLKSLLTQPTREFTVEMRESNKNIADVVYEIRTLTKEIGHLAGTYSTDIQGFMIARDVLPVTVNHGETKTITYTIKYPF